MKYICEKVYREFDAFKREYPNAKKELLFKRQQLLLDDVDLEVSGILSDDEKIKLYMKNKDKVMVNYSK